MTYNTGEHVIPITQFSATSSCGNPIWKYNGFDAANSQQLSYSRDLIKIDSITGDIKINSKKAPGTYRIKLKGTLPDIISTIDWVFDLKISTYQLS